MEMIVIAALAMLALLAFQHRKNAVRRFERVRVRRDARSTHGQTDVPEDRC
jgi:Tfp pilus assembly protein PilE